MAGQANWPGNGFGQPLREIRSMVAHLTAGWPRRETVNTFIRRYTVPGTPKRGIGPQFQVTGDGTVFRLIDMPRITKHASFLNGWAIGVETNNLGTVGRPPSTHWVPASGETEDIPGAKLWITSRNNAHTEVSPAWWTTAAYAGPARGAVGAGRMLFGEEVYRSWALVCRWLMEEHGLPRNFPLLPHATRPDVMRASAPFRRIVLADERADMMIRAFSAAPINITPANFNVGNEAALQTQYNAAVTAGGGLLQHNRAWRKFFDVYRGLHGHFFSGRLLVGHHDHDCPGPVFDFHRLAREVWDWWWYPFDFDPVRATTAVARRPYRKFQADTPLIEYFFDESESVRTARIGTGIHGNRASPTTFALDAASPVYALANGTLVAARFPPEGAGVSLAFALVRHEVFHKPLFPPIVVLGVPMPMPLPDSIDYGRAPSTVYTLYMHLGRPAGMSLNEVREDNPDWLNRVLIRKKECELGVAFYDNDPNHHHIAPGVWSNRPPGVPQRPTTLEGWRADEAALGSFLDALRAGAVALTFGQPFTQPIRILLGDFLGESGVIRRAGTTVTRGIRVETFSPAFVPPSFSLVMGQTGWNPPAGRPRPCLSYVSEWARVPSAAEAQAMTAIGVDTAQLGWWQAVSLAQRLDPTLPRDARLSFAGPVLHYQPIDFARWINGVTWKSEWPKYRVVDAAGTAVPRPARPRTRRV